MNTFKKNQIIITVLAIMIAIAAYLNFSNKSNLTEGEYVFNNEQSEIASIDETGNEESGLVPNEDLLNTNVIEEPDNPIVETSSSDQEALDQAAMDVLPDSDLILDTAQTDTAQIDTTTQVDDTGEAVFVSSTSVASDYFLKSKIDREQTRAYSVEILLDVINNENLSEEEKVNAASNLIELQDCMEKEAAAESLLEAKGYKDVFVRMNVDKESVDVVVNADSLTDTDIAQISDVVSRKTGIDPSKIVISPLKIQN